MQTELSLTAILSLVGAIISVLGVFGIVINAEVVNHIVELAYTAFMAVATLVIYIRRRKKGDIVGAIRKRV
jgi:hypothetical protein